MSIDWSPLAAVIAQHDRFLVTTHVRPDGDALGSEVGMVGLLRQMGRMFASSTPAGRPHAMITSTPTVPCLSTTGRRPRPRT